MWVASDTAVRCRPSLQQERSEVGVKRRANRSIGHGPAVQCPPPHPDNLLDNRCQGDIKAFICFFRWRHMFVEDWKGKGPKTQKYIYLFVYIYYIYDVLLVNKQYICLTCKKVVLISWEKWVIMFWSKRYGPIAFCIGTKLDHPSWPMFLFDVSVRYYWS